MQKIVALIVALALFPSISSAEQVSGKTSSTSNSRVYVVNGSVFVSHGKSLAHQVNGNEAIFSNTLINTGDKSAALLKFEDGQVVTMQANSTFHVREYRYDRKNYKNSSIVFSMFKGGMRFITGLIGQKRKQAFRLLTPYSTIGIRGTEFMVVMLDNSMYSQVQAGNIGITNAAGTAVFGAGQVAVFTTSGALASLAPASAISSSTFSELLSIPVEPSAIPTQASAEAQASMSAAASGTAIASTSVGAVASLAGGSVGVVGGVLADSDTDSTKTTQKPEYADSLQEPADNNVMRSDDKTGMALAVKAGTLGYGADLIMGSDSFSGRLGVNKYKYHKNGNANSMNFDFKLQLLSFTALADWYPFGGAFRLSGGLVNNKNKIKMKAIPGAGATYTIGSNTYSATTAVSSLQGRIAFNPIAPYLGMGWGNPVSKGKGWGMVSDVGVLFQGTPKYSLTATCAAGFAGCAALQADVAAEQALQQESLNKSFKKWPVISIGITYQW